MHWIIQLPDNMGPGLDDIIQRKLNANIGTNISTPQDIQHLGNIGAVYKP